MKYIIKISPEITIKSKPVRKRAFLMLKNNIKKHFEFEGIDAKLSGNRDQIELNSDIKDNSIKNILSCISWIAYFQEVESFELPEEKQEVFDMIFKKTKDFYLDKIINKTFVVRVKRSGVHDFTSIELERYIWGGLLKDAKNSKVKLKGSDITVKIEVKNKKFFIIKQRIEWIWGYPIWFQDRVISLISGGFDSGVSTYSMMKRGCQVDYLFFNLWWSAHELWVKQVSYYLWKTFGIPHKKARFITVPFEEVIKELLTKTNHKYRWVLLKRYMLKVASMISEGNYYAVVKWDSLWQVSSQTLKNMHVIDKASDNLVLRPLISYNKQEIIDISKKIWTYHFACNMPEYCWVISDKPSTWAKLERVLEEESKIEDSILVKSFENRKIEFVDSMLRSCMQSSEENIETVVLAGDNEAVIDIREPMKTTKSPLVLNNIDIQKIPFFDINHRFKDLDQTKTYLFYCEKGILSKLHALYLKEQWFENIKIFRPADSISCNKK